MAKSKTILITGASGLVAGELIPLLLNQNFIVHSLSSSNWEMEGVKNFAWNPVNGEMDIAALDGVDVIYHFAGASIADKAWTKARKNLIIKSRTSGAELLLENCKKLQIKPHFIAASAIGIYTNNGNLVNTESSTVGKGFIAESVNEWEASLKKWESYTKTCILRLSVVLDRNNGAFAVIKNQFKQGACIVLGNGKQMFSWIHIHDVASIMIWAMKEGKTGIFNASSPNPVMYKEFCLSLAKRLGKGLFPAKFPGFILKLVLGERSDLILVSNEVSSDRLKREGFKWKFKKLDDAIAELIS